MKIDYTDNAFDKQEFPKREIVRFYDIPDNLRDWKELTKNMTTEQLLKLKEFVQESIVKKLGS